MIKCVIFVFLYVFVKVRYIKVNNIYKYENKCWQDVKVRYVKVNIIYKYKNKCWQDVVNICKVNLSNYMRGDTIKDHC